MDINATFCHRAKVSCTLWLIIVPNMHKINPFFSEISQQTHKIYEKYCHIKLPKFGMESNAILHASATNIHNGYDTILA